MFSNYIGSDGLNASGAVGLVTGRGVMWRLRRGEGGVDAVLEVGAVDEPGAVAVGRVAELVAHGGEELDPMVELVGLGGEALA